MRNRSGLVAAIALTWHVVTIAAMTMVLSHNPNASAKKESMEENCPLHSKPSCPLHAERHGTHDCDCPTIGCAQRDTGVTGLFGVVGILPPVIGMSAPIDAGKAAPAICLSVNLLAPVPLSPPPRA